MNPPLSTSSLALWPLPLACAILPFIATWIAFALSLQAGYIEPCNPFWDGCTSISRAARHGLANHVFRAVLLPCAMLQILFWWLCRRWLLVQGRAVSALLPMLGVIAGVFLILYATFLGTEGDVYRLLRRYGITFYFGGTYLALLVTLGALSAPSRDRVQRPLLITAAAMLALGVATVLIRALVDDGGVRARWENALEWQLGVLLTAMFGFFAWRWRQARMALLP